MPEIHVNGCDIKAIFNKNLETDEIFLNNAWDCNKVNMSKLREIIFQQNWNEIFLNYSSKNICGILNFDEVIKLANNLFYDNFEDDTIQRFTLNLVLEAKEHFGGRWKRNWKNEVFLGHLYFRLWLYDEQYNCYKKAYDMLSEPPEALILLLAGCDDSTSLDKITAENLLFEAVEKNYL